MYDRNLCNQLDEKYKAVHQMISDYISMVNDSGIDDYLKDNKDSLFKKYEYENGDKFFEFATKDNAFRMSDYHLSFNVGNMYPCYKTIECEGKDTLDSLSSYHSKLYLEKIDGVVNDFYKEFDNFNKNYSKSLDEINLKNKEFKEKLQNRFGYLTKGE